MKKVMISILAILILVLSIAAQEDATGEAVELEMSDSLVIKGMFYASSNEDPSPAVLLLHQLGGSSSEWDEFTTALTASDYNVLVVDQRGFGETGGEADWMIAQDDASTLMTWLREQASVDADKVALVGASIGGNVALRVCSADPDCHTAIALSPGLDFMGVTTEDAVSSMTNQAILIVSTQHDPYGGQDTIKTLIKDAPEDTTIMTKLYGTGEEHATQMFVYPDLIPTMLLWLDSYSS